MVSTDPEQDRSSELAERDRWDLLLVRYEKRIRALCARLFSDRDRIEEAVQEALCTIWLRRGEYDRERGARPSTWAWMVATYTALRLRERMRRAPCAAGGSTARRELEQVPDKEVARALDESIKDVARELALMRHGERAWQMFFAYVCEERDAAKVAADLGVEENTVRTQARRVLQTLQAERKQMEQYGPCGGIGP